MDKGTHEHVQLTKSQKYPPQWKSLFLERTPMTDNKTYKWVSVWWKKRWVVLFLLWNEKVRVKDNTYIWFFLFIIKSIKRDLQTRPTYDFCLFVGPMKDWKLKLRILHISHTPGSAGRNYFVYFISLLWINKAKSKDKIYMWVSVLWETTT